jgi:large subunit ribosomal protein L13
MIIDATDLVMGRVAARAAKTALMGEDVIIINCAKARVTGLRSTTFAKYERMRSMGVHSKGPFLNRNPASIMKRTIRGMLPYKIPKGMAAVKRIKCYTNTVADMKGTPISMPEAHIKKLPTVKHISLSEIAQHLGGKA